MNDSPFAPFHPLAAVAPTPAAARLLLPLCQAGGGTLWVPASLTPPQGARVYRGSLKDHLATLWQDCRGMVLCLAAGAAVRLIAPLLEDKVRDPAVVLLDGGGRFAISLCGGHQGGADRLAELVACQVGATPVVTGASASLGLPGLDVLGLPFGWRRGGGDWTGVSGALARGETVQVIQAAGSTLWRDHLPPGHSFSFSEVGGEDPPRARLWIGPTQPASPSGVPQVQWHPRVLWVGVGCTRGTSCQAIETALARACRERHLAPEAIAGLATLDLKADEAGLLDFCRQRQLPLRTFPPEALRSVAVPNPSETVAQAVGTPSVAEAAAVLAATSPLPSHRSPSPAPLTVPKQKLGTVTLAIAQADLEYTGRGGQLFLVGIGPGYWDQMTPAARTALVRADATIGYSRYLQAIEPLRRPGQIVEAFAITQERQRARRAIELAQWGLSVAVVSSGDCGIYGMAGLVLEELQALGWDGSTPQVEVFPGITALQAAAARVGAPLMQDFCAISLSDLLTPWEAIARRLEAAAAADFVTALYNPRSSTRTRGIATAQEIFLQYRPGNVPVAIVRSAYRPEEDVTLTSLEKMLQFPIDMLSLVLIGNRNTRQHGRWLITPRGGVRS